MSQILKCITDNKGYAQSIKKYPTTTDYRYKKIQNTSVRKCIKLKFYSKKILI